MSTGPLLPSLEETLAQFLRQIHGNISGCSIQINLLCFKLISGTSSVLFTRASHVVQGLKIKHKPLNVL